MDHKSPHIVIVANTAWYLFNFRANLIRLLLAEGWRVSLISSDDEYFTALNTLGDVHVYRLNHLSRKGRRPWQEYRLYRELYNLYKNLQPDAVLQYTIKPNLYGSLAASRLGIPAFSVLPGLGYAFAKGGLLRMIVSIMYRICLRANRHIIFENAEDMMELTRKGIIRKHKALVFNGCGIDTRHFIPLAPLHANSVMKFLFIGRLLKEKGIVEFVQAARQVHERFPQSRFYIAGNIDTENPGGFTLEEFQKIADFGCIEYVGFVEDVRQVIRQADCVVLPSYYPEGLPRVLLESISMEKPVIATDTRGCHDAIEHGRNGFLTIPRNATDLASKMILICEMPYHQRMQMGQYGRQKALNEFDDKLINQRYFALLEDLICPSAQ